MENYESLSDQELVDRLKADDNDAFSEIFRRYGDLLLLYAFRRIQNVEHSKNLIHDAFVGIWEKRTNVHITDGLRPFLITVIKNRILDYYKQATVSQAYLDNFDSYLRKEEEDSNQQIKHNQLATQ